MSYRKIHFIRRCYSRTFSLKFIYYILLIFVCNSLDIFNERMQIKENSGKEVMGISSVCIKPGLRQLLFLSNRRVRLSPCILPMKHAQREEQP